MKKQILFAMMLLRMLAFDGLAGADVLKLKSSKLRIAVDSTKSEIAVIEHRNGKVLVIQNAPMIQVNEKFKLSKIVSATVEDGTINLTLTAANEPGVISAGIRFVNPQVIEISIEATKLKSKSLQIQFQDRKDEFYYGVWESIHGGNLNNRGATADFLGTQIADNVDFSSGRAPYYMSSAGYGVYIPTAERGSFSFGQKGTTGFSFKQTSLKYFILYGPEYSRILSLYNKLSGPVYMPPLWAYGTGWWRDDAHFSFHGKVANAQQNIMDDAVHLQDNHIPAAWIWVDRPYGTGDQGWGNFDFDSSFPNPRGLADALRARGLQLMVWVANKAFGSSQLWNEGLKRHFLFLKNPGSALDVSKIEAYKWFQGKLGELVKLGVKGYKVDRGEEDPDGMPDELKNSLNDTFVKLAAESLRKKLGSDYFVFSRSLNGPGRKYSALWNGDAYSTFGGLRTSVSEALRAGLIGFPMWGSDTGGIMSNHPPKEVFARWFAFSAYSPMMEVLIGGNHTPWYDYDDEMIEIARKYSEVHHDLIPYTRSMMYESKQSGLPVMRPLFLAFANDTSISDCADEYLYGSELLVAPVLQEGAVSRRVYFPEGKWLDNSDKTTVHTGRSTKSVPAPIKNIPVFVREGAVLVRGDVIRGNNFWTSSWNPHLEIEFFPSHKRSGHFTYYDGKNATDIVMKVKKKVLEISWNDLGIKGEARIYVRGFQSVLKNGEALEVGAGFRFNPSKHLLRIRFSGRTTITLRGFEDIFSDFITKTN